MLNSITTALKGLPKEWITVIIAMLPISELRGAIPAALMMGIPPARALLLSVIGNAAPVIPVLVLLEPVSNFLMRFGPWKRFFDWLFRKARSRAELVQKYEAIGLALFVAVPLPITGAWTGCVAASLFRVRFRYAFPAILIGIMTAGGIVLSVCLFGKGALSFFLAK